VDIKIHFRASACATASHAREAAAPMRVSLRPVAALPITPGSMRRARDYRSWRRLAAGLLAVVVAAAISTGTDAFTGVHPDRAMTSEASEHTITSTTDDACNMHAMRRPSARVAGGASISRSDADEWVATYSAMRAEYYLDFAQHLLDIALTQVSV
jgi:hypothetical protein